MKNENITIPKEFYDVLIQSRQKRWDALEYLNNKTLLMPIEIKELKKILEI